MLDTPVQGNLDEYGYYLPGEVGRLPLPVNVSGASVSRDPESEVSSARLWQRTPGTATKHYTENVEQHQGVDRILVGLHLSCGRLGAVLTVYGDWINDLVGDRVQVEWSTDGAPARQQVWNVISQRSAKQISPARAVPLIAFWRNASMLELTVHSPDPFTRQFNLGAMFDIPIVATFDECLAAPTPVQSLPVSDARLTYDGDISFAAERLYGSTWITSFVDILDNGPSPTQVDADDTRAILTISCEIDGRKISIIDLDEMQTAFIPGEQVEVKWEADGRSEAETWEAWTLLYDDAIALFDSPGFYEHLRNARALTIRVASDPPITKTYELEQHGFWDTPVQPNPDACAGLQ